MLFQRLSNVSFSHLIAAALQLTWVLQKACDIVHVSVPAPPAADMRRFQGGLPTSPAKISTEAPVEITIEVDSAANGLFGSVTIENGYAITVVSGGRRTTGSDYAVNFFQDFNAEPPPEWVRTCLARLRISGTRMMRSYLARNLGAYGSPSSSPRCTAGLTSRNFTSRASEALRA